MSRIIAGSHGGRRLTMPPGDQTRPTTDRVREALFSALTAWVGTAAGPAESALDGLAVLDLYAGSGAVGLEAASRGAGPVTLVELSAKTAQITRKNVADLRLPARVETASVATWLQRTADRSYDIVFADPPYELSTSELDDQVTDLTGRGWLAPDGLIVLERSRRSVEPRWPREVVDHWHRSYGETVLHFAQVAGQDRPGHDPTGQDRDATDRSDQEKESHGDRGD